MQALLTGNTYTRRVGRKGKEIRRHCTTHLAHNRIFLVDVLNFSFWSDLDDGCKENSERYTVKYKGKLYTGYWSLCAAINRALDAGIPITSPAYYANASAQDIAKVFASETKESIPLFKERVDVIHEAGKVLLEVNPLSLLSEVKG